MLDFVKHLYIIIRHDSRSCFICCPDIRAVSYTERCHKAIGGENMKNYEVLFILDPVMDDEAKKAMIERVKEIINDGGEAGEVDVWGNKRLAYEINKKKDGYYVVIQFKANPDMPKELDRRLRISDSIMRHIIVLKDEQ